MIAAVALRLVLAATLVVAVSLGALAQAERRVALVIGKGAYRHAAPLSNPPNDARRMADVWHRRPRPDP